MATRSSSLVINYKDIVSAVQKRTFKFGKARDNKGVDQKLVNNVKATDLQLDMDIVLESIKNKIGYLAVLFTKYMTGMESQNEGTENQVDTISFVMPGEWDHNNEGGFKSDCREYVINAVISDFLDLSLPKEAELYAQKAQAALQGAERKLYFKRV